MSSKSKGTELSGREKQSPICPVAAVLIFVILRAVLLMGSLQTIGNAQEPSGATAQASGGTENGTKENDIRVAYVGVMDKKKTPIADLKIEDFSVRENRVPQQILEVSPAWNSSQVIGVLVDVSGSRTLETNHHEVLMLYCDFLVP